MKKVILFSALAVTGFISQAQTMFGAQAGANFASVKEEYTGYSDNSDSKVGFIIGAVADVPFGGMISFRPELNFIQKGGKSETTNVIFGTTYKDETELTLSYIQLSPNFVYNIAAGKGKVFLGLGPEFAFGMGGKYKSTTTTSGTGGSTSASADTDVKFDGEENATSTDPDFHLKAFDFGGNIIAGYKMAGGFYISTGYTMGFANISPDNGYSIKNRGFNVKLGYMFGGMKKK